MSLKTGSIAVKGSLEWTYTKTPTGFNPVSQQGSVAFNLAPDAATYDHAYISQFTLAASASSTIDLYSFTSIVGESVTATKLLGYSVYVTGLVAGGQIKIEEGATNPATFPLSGTTPAITLSVGTGLKCGIVIINGAAYTLSSTIRNIKFSNPGTQTVTVNLAVLVGS